MQYTLYYTNICIKATFQRHEVNMTRKERFDSLIARIQKPENSHMFSYVNMVYKNRLSISWHVKHIINMFYALENANNKDRDELEKSIDSSLDQIEFLLNDQNWL